MRLIDADLLIADILEARRSETDTVPKLIVFINNQPTEAWKGLTPTADVMEALEDLARNGSQSRFCKYEPKHGKWEDREVFDNASDIVEEWQSERCSECNKYLTTPYSYYFYHHNYCPYCGARMEE